jgi:hypothetical protein
MREPVTKEERRANCLVAPNGDWYNVGLAEHEKFAREYCKENNIPKDNHLSCLDVIVRTLKWVSIEDSMMTGTIVSAPTMSRRQYQVLKESFGNQLLFMGWTIDDTYAKAEHPEGD